MTDKEPLRGSRTRTRLVAGGVAAVVLVVGGAAAVAAAFGGGSDDPDDALDLAVATATVSRRTLELTDDTTATLTFVASHTVSAPAAGTVTALVGEGDEVAAGTIVGRIDGEPVVALYGDLPPWRDLDASADDGADVYQLELNLVALGFDPDGAIAIDETYDGATTAAVERWQESLDLEATGDVPQSLIVAIPGRILIDDVAATVGGGVASGGSLVSGRVVERHLAVASTSPDPGTVTAFAAPGTPATTGTLLFTDGGYPVVAVEGAAATLPLLERDLAVGVDDGADVRLLEQLLDQLGFDTGGTLEIDDSYDDATAAAVAAWYTSLGLTPTDPTVVPAGSFVVVPSGLEVGQPLVDDGTDPGRQTPALALTAPARVVTTTAPLGDDAFAVGNTVEVTFPDGSTTPGTVTEVGTQATNATGQPGGEAVVPITIQVTDIPASVAGFVEIPVTLRVITQSIPDAFVVPTSALVALTEGGYALEMVDGPGATHLIPVETGVFADGFVEVTGPDLADGLTVVVPG